MSIKIKLTAHPTETCSSRDIHGPSAAASFNGSRDVHSGVVIPGANVDCALCSGSSGTRMSRGASRTGRSFLGPGRSRAAPTFQPGAPGCPVPSAISRGALVRPPLVLSEGDAGSAGTGDLLGDRLSRAESKGAPLNQRVPSVSRGRTGCGRSVSETGPPSPRPDRRLRRWRRSWPDGCGAPRRRSGRRYAF